MANPCEYYIGNKKFTEEEFKNHLAKGALDKFIDDNSIDLSNFKYGEEAVPEIKEEPIGGPSGMNTPPDADEDLIKMANAVNDEFVKSKFGLDALDNVISKLQDTSLENIIQKVKDAIKINPKLIKERRDAIISMKTGSEFDQALLMYDLAELKGRENSIRDKILTETDPNEIVKLQKQLIDVSNEMQDNALANHILGRSASTMFRLRQLWVNKELTIQDMRDQYKASKGVQDLTPEQEKDINAAYETIREAQKNLDKAKKDLEDAREENAKLIIENEKLKELQEEADKNKKADRAKTANEKVQKSQVRVQKSLDNLKKLGGQATAGFDPKIAIELSKIAAEKFYQGVVKFDQLVKDVYDEVKDALPNFTKEDIVNHLLYTVNKKGELEPTLLSEKYNQLKKSKDKSDKVIREKVKAYEQAQKEMALKQFNWEQDRRADMMKNQSWKNQITERILSFQRFNVLSYPTTFIKLLAAVGHALFLKPIKVAFNILTSAILPKGIVEKASIFGNQGIKSELKAAGAYYSAFIKNFTLAALKENFKGIDTKEMLYGKRGMYDEFNVGSGLLEMPGRSHGYIKSFIKTAEFAYAHEKQLNYNMTKAGEIQEKLNNDKLTKEERAELKKEYKNYDVTNPETLDRINRLSLEHGKWSILMNDTKFNDKLGKFLNENPILKTELPIVKIPFNYIGRAFAIKYGLIRALVGKSEWESKKVGGESFPGLIEVLYKGSDNLTESQANLIAKSLQLGSMGVTFFALGYLNAKNIKKKEDGSYEIFGKPVSKLLAHSPEYDSIISGAETANKKEEGYGFIESYVNADIEMIANNPFSNFFQYGAIPKFASLLAQKIGPKGKDVDVVGKSSDIIAKKISDMAIPGFSKQIATSFDTEEGKGFHPLGTTIKRFPAGEAMDRFFQTFEQSIPVLRKNVPTEEESKYINKYMNKYKGPENKEVRQDIIKSIRD